ncbi:putative DNA-binding domain-containing protein [Thiotrichales bacterium 19S11-10]|nr:putative DNA-binding domain-containing protein [Thiotrichales bacterium 19S11-10]
MMLEFQKMQQDFALCIRNQTDEHCPAVIDKDRLLIYQSCFLNGINEILSNCFPILSALLGSQKWLTLVKSFYQEHPAKSPLFYEIPAEFLSFLHHQKSYYDRTIPCLFELAHYEWMELALEIAEEKALTINHLEINFEHTVLSVSPLAEVVAYHYPVHQIGIDSNLDDIMKNETYLCIYRNLQDEVKFIELNQMSAKFLLLLKQMPQSAEAVLKSIQLECNHINYLDYVNSCQKLVIELSDKGILYTA